jgi:hypothetical protein
MHGSVHGIFARLAGPTLLLLLLQAHISPHSVMVHGSFARLAGPALLLLLLQAHVSPHSVIVHGSFG